MCQVGLWHFTTQCCSISVIQKMSLIWFVCSFEPHRVLFSEINMYDVQHLSWLVKVHSGVSQRKQTRSPFKSNKCVQSVSFLVKHLLFSYIYVFLKTVLFTSMFSLVSRICWCIASYQHL